MQISRWTYAAAAAMLVAAAVSGCGGSSSKKSANGLEKTNINVGVLPIVDDAPLFMAIQKGYFKAEGLNVHPIVMANGAEAITRVNSGGLDLGWSSYANLFSAVAGGDKMRVVVDGYGAVDHLFDVVVLPSSKIKKPADLVGKTISVNDTHGLGPLLLDSALKTAGVDPTKVHLRAMPFPNAPAALQTKAIDAAWLTEPFLTQASKNLGATEILDTATGPAENLPIAGWVSSNSTVAKEPKVMAAFQRAIAKAQVDAGTRSAVEQILPTYIKTITPQVASTITIGSYPTSLSAVRLQRVADLMQQNGMLNNRLNAQSLLIPSQ